MNILWGVDFPIGRLDMQIIILAGWVDVIPAICDQIIYDSFFGWICGLITWLIYFFFQLVEKSS